jgi:membrane-associated phospholipid phosphatase
MKILLARIISYVLNPLTVLVLVPFFLVYRTTHDLQSAILWTIYTFAFLLAITLFLFYGVKKKYFTDLDVSKREQRPLLFKACGILIVLYSVGLFLFKAPIILPATTFGIIFGILVISIVNRKIKASLHVATISACIFAIAIVYRGFNFFLLLLIPLVAWARVKTKRHTISETIVGGALGILLSLGMYLFIKLNYV